MSAHPNRSRRADSPARNPKPEEIVALREQYGITQTQLAEICWSTINGVQKWEAPSDSPNHRRLHPLMWWAMQRRLEEWAAEQR